MIIPDEYLKQYASLHKPIHDEELSSYSQSLFGDIAYDIVYGHRVKIDTKKVIKNNEHQYRSRTKTKELLAEKVSALLASGKAYQSFEDIYSEVSSMLVEERHLTHLMAYDISLRIGARARARDGILPNDFVYLHAGALDGAKKLKEHLYPNFPIQTPRIETAKIKEIVKELGDYTACDIEHFLCVYHKQL